MPRVEAPPPRGMRVLRAVAAVLLLGASLASGAPARAETLQLAVATNFAEVTRALVPLFEAAHGHRVRASFASTGALYAQILHGAPFEVFLAADVERPARAEAEGLAVPGTRFTYARGRLVLWSAQAGIFRDGEAYVKSLAFAHLAIANPATAPYGRAARDVMERLGIWEEVGPRLLRGTSVAQAFQFVATGHAEVGFVAFSQVQAWQKASGSLWEIPASYYAPIDQQAVLLEKGREDSAARSFLGFLKTRQARAVIARYGYQVE